jgi:hypothetical protein
MVKGVTGVTPGTSDGAIPSVPNSSEVCGKVSSLEYGMAQTLNRFSVPKLQNLKRAGLQSET